MEIEQVIIARDDELDLSGERKRQELIIVRIAADGSWQRCRCDDFGERLNLRKRALARDLGGGEDGIELGPFEHFGEFGQERRTADERHGAIADAIKETMRCAVPESRPDTSTLVSHTRREARVRM